MDSHHAIVHLSFIAVPLSSDAHGVLTALAHPRFIHGADGFGVSVVADHDLLATIAQFFFIPLDRFEKTL
jgi:hypothetical protein